MDASQRLGPTGLLIWGVDTKPWQAEPWRRVRHSIFRVPSREEQTKSWVCTISKTCSASTSPQRRAAHMLSRWNRARKRQVKSREPVKGLPAKRKLVLFSLLFSHNRHRPLFNIHAYTHTHSSGCCHQIKPPRRAGLQILATSPRRRVVSQSVKASYAMGLTRKYSIQLDDATIPHLACQPRQAATSVV